MPGWASLSMGDEILNFYYRGTAITVGGSLWIRLLVNPSSRAGGGTETNYGGYARYEVVRNGTVFGVAASGTGQLVNTISIVLPIATTTGNGDLVWFDFVNTASGAFTKHYNGGPILPARSVIVGKAPTFGPGKLVLTF